MVYAELICVAVMNLGMPRAAFVCGWDRLCSPRFGHTEY